MLGCKTLPLMEALYVRKWSDEENVQDVEFVKGALSEKLKGMRYVRVAIGFERADRKITFAVHTINTFRNWAPGV